MRHAGGIATSGWYVQAPDHIEISLSNELTTWRQTLKIQIDAPGFGADALEGTILNPIYGEGASRWWLMWASNAPGCDGSGGYKGAAILRGEGG